MHFSEGTPRKIKKPEDQETVLTHLSNEYDLDDEGNISFSRACEGELNQLGQYASAFIDGFDGKPLLAADLVTGDPAKWNSLKITPANFIVFCRRFEEHKQTEIEKILGELGTL